MDIINKKIQKCLTFIRNSVVCVDSVVANLIQKDVIPLEEGQDYFGGKLPKEQIQMMIDVVIRKEKGVEFLLSLTETKNEHVVEKILSSDVANFDNMGKLKTVILDEIECASTELTESKISKELNNIKKENERLKELQKNLRQQIEEKVKRLKDGNTQLIKYKKTQEDLERKNERLEKENKELAEQNKELMEENQELAEQNKELSEESNKLADLNTELAEQNKELVEESKDLADLNKELAEENKEICHLQQMVELLRKQIDDKDKKIIKMTSWMKNLENKLKQEMKTQKKVTAMIVKDRKELNAKINDLYRRISHTQSQRYSNHRRGLKLRNDI